MAASSKSWAQVVGGRHKLITPFKETYHRRKTESQLVAHLKYLEHLVDELRQENHLLRTENALVRDRVSKLELVTEEIRKGSVKGDLAKDIIQECVEHPNPVLLSFIEQQVSLHKEALVPMSSCGPEGMNLQENIQASLREERDRQAREKNMRVGGVDKDLIEEFAKEGGSHFKFHVYFWGQHRISFPEFEELEIIGNQALMSFSSKELRNEALRQARKLKGSKIWFAEDLTKMQLKQRHGELLKVRLARKEGLWARYQGGIAVIRRFRTTSPRGEEGGAP